MSIFEATQLSSAKPTAARSLIRLDAKGIALFALIGVAGAAATSLAGRWGDRGWTRPMLLAAHLLIVGSLALCAWAALLKQRLTALVLLSFGTILLDVGITTDQT